MKQVGHLVFMRSQENPGVLQVMAMVVSLLLFNIYGVAKTTWGVYTVLSYVMPEFLFDENTSLPVQPPKVFSKKRYLI